MADLQKLVDELSGLTVLEAAELSKLLEDKWGVSAAAPVAVAAAPTAGAPVAEAPEEEQTEFAVILTSPGAQKIPVIKAVREITQLGLREAKALVDEAPKPVVENVPRERAEEVKNKLAEAGAEVEIK